DAGGDTPTAYSLIQSCYTGDPISTRGVGICHAGTRTCTAGSWGSCEDEVTPTSEVCAVGATSQDEDCDTFYDCGDSDSSCVINRDIICTDNVCGDGARDSAGVDDTLGTADDEQCDDGNIVNDDGCSSICKWEDEDMDTVPNLVDVCPATLSGEVVDLTSGSPAFGCSASQRDTDSDTHDALVFGGDDCDDSNANINPSKSEICNGFDDNCNALIDTDATASLTTLQEGVCEGRMQVCTNSVWSDNYPSDTYQATTELTCSDELDNDCDGFADLVDPDCINAELTPDEALDTLLGRMLFTAKVGRKIKGVTNS
ncbi:hypothetical protein HYX13_03350, partial [Candidatus Woesearchaeota archaeon]|nr:hypothetical protein [Candidatus Woesearchaeota archaeon]